MIYRLIYCNKNGDSARIDIIKGALPPVETIEGTDNPFLLSYKMDTSNKSGFFMTSSANISVYESGTFNIDNLKTSSETELKVEYYINEVLFWSGFIIPDFFSRNIGVPATIEMVASDRIGTLKGSTLSSLTQYVSMRDIAVACLAKTGLSLPLLTMADFGNNGQTNAFFKSLGLSGRLSDTKGRNISCYDILRSILVACDGKLLQQDGAWYIVNKFQHEQGSGNLFSSLTASTPYVEQSVPFSEVDTGARRTIIPVAATTGVYHEHGGNRPRPINYDFTQMLSGWTTVGGFNAIIGDKLIKQFTAGGSGGAIISIVPDNNITIKPYLINNNEYIRNINPKYIESSNIDIPYTGYGVININVDVNATGPAIAHPSRPSAFMRIAVVAVKGTTVKTLDHGGAFINMPSENPPVFAKEFERGTDFTNIRAVTSGMIVNGKLEIPEGDSFSNWKIKVRIYGSGGGYDVAFNSTIVKLSLGATDSPKGNIYKRNQGANFTSEYPVDTTIFGDYITNGLNGYFYNYSIDDTSSLFSAPDVLIEPKWTAHADANELPLLQHVARQRSRMFSIAHDLINASIDVEAFKPLSIFVDCNSKRYCVVSANFDFLRSKVEVEIEQISYASLEVREFIYSYFGDSDTGISSVGGISGGSTGTGTGGGMTAEQIEILSWWKKDPDNPNTIFTEMNAYSKLELSAYGVGDGGGGGGSDYERLDTWASYDSSKAGWVLSALLGNDLNTRVTAIDGRVTDLENSAGGGSVTSVGISVPTGLSVSNSPITSSGVIAIGLQTGYSIPTTAKQGQWDTAFTNNHTHSNKTVLDGITSTLVSNWDTAYTNRHTHSNKTQLDLITQSNIDVLAKLSIVNGNLQIDGNAYATGELSAYGIGSGGSGGSYERLDAWVDYDSTKSGWVLSALLGNELNTRVGNLEGGSALTVNTTGTGNAITSISKAGTVITATKGATFSLSNHLHTGVYEPVFTKNTAFNKNFGTTAGTVAEGNHTHTFASLTNKPTTLAGYEITDAVTTNTTQTITGTKTFRNWKIDSLEGALGIQSYRVGTGMLWPYGNALSAIRTGLGFGWYNTEWVIGNIRGGAKDSYGFGIGYKNADGNLDGEFRIAPGGAAYLNNVQIATISSNVASATKLQTARTIWGQSFDGTGNVTGALSGATTGSFTGTITSPLYQSGAYNWVSKTGGFHSGTDGYQTGGLSIYDGTGTTANFYRLNNLLILGRAANQSLTIDTSSNVNILGDTSTNRLIISSTAAASHIEFSRPSYNYITTPLNGSLSFVTNGDSNSALNSMMILSPNGNVGIGKGFTNNTTAITAQLHVRGTIVATGEITAYVASDRRLKHNITPLFSSLDIIDKLNPVSYYWNKKAKELNPMKPDSLDYGLIAQEVENVLPGVVHGIFDDKYKSIDYIKLIPIMIAAIKELKKEINNLKN